MWNLAGHEKAIRLLSSMLLKDMVSHAYLFHGPARIGKTTLAITVAMAINCVDVSKSRPCGECSQCERITSGNHPDVQVIEVMSNEEIKGIDQIRDIQHSSSLKPYEGERRIFILPEISQLSIQASNALLRLLEEPPEKVTFLLTSTNLESVIPTILSRCQIIGTKRVPDDEIIDYLTSHFGITPGDATHIARISQGQVGWAIEASTNPELLEDYDSSLSLMDSILIGNLDKRFKHAEEMAYTYTRNRHKALQQLSIGIAWWRDILMLKESIEGSVCNFPIKASLRRHSKHIELSDIVATIKAFQNTILYLESNVNPRLAFEALVLNIPILREFKTPTASVTQN